MTFCKRKPCFEMLTERRKWLDYSFYRLKPETQPFRQFETNNRCFVEVSRPMFKIM